MAAAKTGFASGVVTCKLGALSFHSSSVLVDPEYSGCSETRPNAKPENVMPHYKTTDSKNEIR